MSVPELAISSSGSSQGIARSSTETSSKCGEESELIRALTWKDVFWLAAGVPPLVLFSIGGLAGVAGNAAFLVWIISMCMGFSQSFTYAEMAGMFGNKSGGASVYGALAWVRYSKFIAPLSVWCNWFAWSPVLSLGCSIASAYILNLLASIPISGLSEIHTWQAFTVHIQGLGDLNFNMTFAIGTLLMILMFAIQHRGIASTASVQKWLALMVLVPLLLAGLVPIVLGKIHGDHFESIVPPSARNSGQDGSWNRGGWTLILGAMYMGAWTTYAFETAVCYTSELKNPQTDTFKSICSAGLLCMVFFFVIPFSFQGVLGLEGMKAPGIIDGTGIAEALARMAGGHHPVITNIFVILMILGLFLAIMTAMAGSSRTLYQGSKDGWLPKFLAGVNQHGAPTGAMLTDFVFNLFLLALASDPEGYYKVMAISNVGYILFNFLNLNAGWIHRIDSGHIARPWRAPTILIGFNAFLSLVNALFLGAGAKVWGYSSALWEGLIFASLIIPVFAYRHYWQDGGKFPEDVMVDLGLKVDDMGERKAGVLPYLMLILGLAVMLFANWFFVLPA